MWWQAAHDIPNRKFRLLFTLSLMLWLSALAGFALLTSYDLQPGRQAHRIVKWPALSKLELSKTSSTLIVFLHPQCACSFATIHELHRVITLWRRPLKVYAVIWLPPPVPEGWLSSPLLKEVESIPGIETLPDQGGLESTAFGAQTSGTVLLYSSGGHLLFSGGITGLRGHEGDNAGANALLAKLSQPGTPTLSSPIFGCGLNSPEQQMK